MANVFLRNTAMQTMIRVTVTTTSKKLMTAARAAMIVVLSCTCSVVVPSWLVAVGESFELTLSIFR